MGTQNLAALISKQITLIDTRTGITYRAEIRDSKEVYGWVRLTLDGVKWFQPTHRELESVK